MLAMFWLIIVAYRLQKVQTTDNTRKMQRLLKEKYHKSLQKSLWLVYNIKTSSSCHKRELTSHSDRSTITARNWWKWLTQDTRLFSRWNSNKDASPMFQMLMWLFRICCKSLNCQRARKIEWLVGTKSAWYNSKS